MASRILGTWVYLLWTCVLVSGQQELNEMSGLPMNEDGYPEGFYSFVEGSPMQGRPPRVRKPPYRVTDLPCPGSDKPKHLFLPKDTLCGDLNLGFVPNNPMGQKPLGEPYPFELIRNKTLEYLGRTLPFLTGDPRLPKVAKFVSPGLRDPLMSGPPLPAYYIQKRRSRRSRTLYGTRFSKRTLSESAFASLSEILAKATGEGRKKLCQDENHFLCTFSKLATSARLPLAVLSSVSSTLANLKEQANGTVSTLSPSEIVLTVAGAAIRAALKASVQDTDDTNIVDTKVDGETRAPWTKVLTTLANLATGSKTSPLSSMVDLVAGSQAVSNLISAVKTRRRPKPSRSEAILQGGHDLPPTPCPSVEEYVTPTFARNYQGVWKYVVQIPHEGYFTQTIQNIKCRRGRCEFTDGLCHESPRWVSLLVAELYYPQAIFPTHRPSSTGLHSPLPPGPVTLGGQAPPPVEDFPHFQQYLHRRVGQNPDVETRGAPRLQEPHSHNKVIPTSKRPVKGTTKDKCDGYDQVGCFIVRMYYDWFLVNGSCKCWKASLKRVLFEDR